MLERVWGTVKRRKQALKRTLAQWRQNSHILWSEAEAARVKRRNREQAKEAAAAMYRSPVGKGPCNVCGWFGELWMDAKGTVKCRTCEQKDNSS